MKKKYFPLFIFLLSISSFAQKKDKIQQKKDSLESLISDTSDRNVGLNAANNKGPRDVNVGLPASIGGTALLENGLPVVYFFWPELPTKAWRKDATINKSELYNLGQTAIYLGDVGFSLSTYDNLGTDKFQVNGSMNSEHFGLTRNTVNLSGPLFNTGLKFTAGAYISLDPGTFKAEGFPKYYADRAQLYKLGLTQDYKTSKSQGSITAFYKYAKTEGANRLYAPFRYGKKGKVYEIPGFTIGRDSYMERSRKITLKDAFTGQMVERDIIKDYGTESNTIDLIWKHQLNTGLKLNGIIRYHEAKSGYYTPIMTGIIKSNPGEYIYEDGTPYTGENVQGVMILATRRTPIKTFMADFNIEKKHGNHSWKIGMDQWNYDVNKYATESVQYNQEVAANPRKIRKITENSANFNYNTGEEYHDGSENKTALYAVDNWEIGKKIILDLGGRVEYQNIRGNFQDRELQLTDLNGPKTRIKKDWFNKAFMLNAIYKLIPKFGILAEASYNEQNGHLEAYNIGVDPNLKKSKIPEAGLGVFFNHSKISIVSKATYIKRDEYRATVNFVHPITGLVTRTPVQYNIETIGWTTDILTNPFKNFTLHCLITLQNPQYKNYKGKVLFTDGASIDYNFDDKIVNEVSKFLLEIDPSYIWNDLRVWGSARYFSKTYANLPNSLYFEGRWETFAGAEYKVLKNLSLSATIVNLLNQKGAKGSISGTDLVDKETAEKKIGTIMSGTYIRPFTIEMGAKFQF